MVINSKGTQQEISCFETEDSTQARGRQETFRIIWIKFPKQETINVFFDELFRKHGNKKHFFLKTTLVLE